MRSYEMPDADNDLQNLQLLTRSKKTVATCHYPTKIVQENMQHDRSPPDVNKKREREADPRNKRNSSR